MYPRSKVSWKWNEERVGRSADFVMSIMSVREGEQSVKQNESLNIPDLGGYFVLPFNAVPAVLAIQAR